MDIYCRNCGEPWEVGADETNPTKILAGNCDCCHGAKSKKIHSETLEIQTALADVLGDDIDGLAASMEDFHDSGFNAFAFKHDSPKLKS